jgi:molybdopterin molybdotransferase
VSLIPVEDALARILDGVTALEGEMVPLAAALRRVTANDIPALRTQPPFEASAMDGYAVCSADFPDGGPLPVSLKLVGESAAGHPFTGSVKPGETARIFTGAIVPDGADAILIQENATADGATILANEPIVGGKFIRKRGLDFSEGDSLIARGTWMRPRHLSLAAAMNHADIDLVRKPRVGILATGDELVQPGSKLGPGQIISSNNIGIHGLVERLGGTPVDLGIAADTEASLAETLANAKASNLDILVTLGGASVGDHDLVLGALEREGMSLGFWRIAMRPGKPLMFGRLDDMRVLGLPGNPVSAMVCAEIFLRPLIRALLGLDPNRVPDKAILDDALPENDKRQDYLRARITGVKDDLKIVTAFSRQDSSMLGNLARADCLILRPPFARAAKAGDPVDILLLDDV